MDRVTVRVIVIRTVLRISKIIGVSNRKRVEGLKERRLMEQEVG